jgi:hypothetical protein
MKRFAAWCAVVVCLWAGPPDPKKAGMDAERLALSDPVEKYLPEFRPLKRTWRPITIRDLLTHTAGVNMPEMICNIMSTLDLTLADAVSY